MSNLRANPNFSYSVKDAAAALGISPSLLEQIIARGDLHPQWINSKRVIRAAELQGFVDNLPYDRPGVAS